jgi:hypothetical protein
MPFGFNRVQSHADILEVLAKAQAQNKEVVVNDRGTVKVEGFWGRRSRVRQERAQGPEWASNQKLVRNAAVANSLKQAFARQGVDVDTLPQAHHLRDLLNAVPAKPNLPGVKFFSEGVRQLFPGFNLKNPSLDRLRPDDIDKAPDMNRAPIAAAAPAQRRGTDYAVMNFPAAALANPDDPNALPANLKRVHDNLASLMHIYPHFGLNGIRRDEFGQTNLFQYEAINAAIGAELPKVLDPSKTYLYAIAPDSNGRLHLRIGFEHERLDRPGSKLGHPSMTQDLNREAKALIGGELRFNPTQNGWEIDENSGRYGLFPPNLLAQKGISILDVMQYAALRFEAVGFRLANINAIPQ